MFELALVGAGRMGRTHLRALAASRTVRVAHIVEPAAVARQRLAGTGAALHACLDDLLASAAPDGALVAAPTGRHLSIVERLAAAGVPVLCEKPAGLTPEQVRRAGEAAARHRVALQVAYWRRYVPALCDLRERIRAGRLGEVLSVRASQWDAAPPAAAFRATSGGIFVDMAVHEFDQIRWLTGQDVDELRAVAATAVTDARVRGDVDAAQALLRMSGGATGLVCVGRHHPGGDAVWVEVFGTRGHERLDILDPAGGDAALLAALARQAEGFAELVRGGRTGGAATGDAIAALTAAGQATRCIGLPGPGRGAPTGRDRTPAPAPAGR